MASKKVGSLAVLLVGGVLLTASGRRGDLDHVIAYNFVVEIDGVQAGYFRSVDDFAAGVGVIEFQDGDDYFLRKRPGRPFVSDLTLNKGYIVTQDLQDWWVATQKGQHIRKQITVRSLLPSGDELRAWHFFECWPHTWQVNALDGRDPIVEKITFAVEATAIAGEVEL